MNHQRAMISPKNGFSLLELLVAITILTVALLALAGLQSTAINANSTANRLSVASALAQEVMEEITSWNTSDPRLHFTVGDSIYDLDAATHQTSRFILGAGTYTAAFSTETNRPVAGVTRITVTIYYTTPNASSKSVSLTSHQRTI